MVFRGPIILACFVVFTLLAGVASTAAAATDATAEATSPDNLEALVQTLEDPDRRAVLLRDLRALIAAQKKAEAEEAPGFGASLLAEFTRRIGAVSEQLVAAANLVFELPTIAGSVRDALAEPETRAFWLGVIGKLALVLAAGVLAEIVVRAALRRPQASVEARAGDGFWLTVVLLLARTVLDLAPIAMFAAAAYGGLALFGPDQAGRLVAVALINASVLARAVIAIARMMLAPRVAQLRLFPIGDETANYVFVWVKRIANLTIYGYFVVHASRLLGLQTAANNALLKALGLAVVLLLIMVVLQNRHEVARWLRGDGGGALPILRRRFADIWHILMIVYLVASYTVWALEIRGGFEFVLRATVLTITIVIAGRLVELSLRKAVSRAFALGQELNARLPGLEARANRYLPVVQSVARAVLYVLILLAILQAWGVGVFSWFASETAQILVGRAILIALIVCLAFVAWEIVGAMVERYLTATDSAGNSVQRSQRARTLLPLMRNAFTVVLAVVVTLTVLSELGLNIGPLLAGAGVVGLAIGFGAQTLVKDVITGVFILLEDSISAGDVVEVAGHSGVVEAMTIRTIRLRDLSGTVHTVPFSDVTSIKNLTRGFSYAFMEIGVAYREDIDAVMKVIEELGAEMRADPEYADSILEDIQVQGLDRFADSAIIIRARIKTKPLQQWGVRRAFNLRMKRRFDELGIEIPFPHQTIYFGEDREGNAPAAPVRLIKEAEGKPAPRAESAPPVAVNPGESDKDQLDAASE